MGLIDLKPLGDVEKYLQLAVVCGVSFFATLGSVGAGMLASGSSIALSLATGFFSACLVMSAALLNAARKAGLKTPLPDGLEKIVSGTDLQQPNPRRYLE